MKDAHGRKRGCPTGDIIVVEPLRKREKNRFWKSLSQTPKPPSQNIFSRKKPRTERLDLRILKRKELSWHREI
ncbi:hypothetical protein G4H71_20370 [Rhodococcus triatomae]|uniref:Uncharacterized protein n=1 Tax=Rhodococcus triatomae TaxID=300028 RepID=A0A1G8S687_9NOCA|nr:hypothetical protein [Rhodococcus triatomae]QNG19004.1 hypothetical protein G4H72_10010 [Rhodococcus triatomae]QNG25083.1 hypothetical protein G4H71_20370 [Rhodococcus triatomae]SDJ24707.1 hypothetical protein SAMN05444695_1206 [Rhodococcus triatomae]